MFVDLVGDDGNVVLLCQLGQLVQLLPLVDLAQGIVGVIEDDHLGLIAEEGLELVKVQLPVGGADDALRLGLRDNRTGFMI